MTTDIPERAVEAADLGGSFSGDMSIFGLFMSADIVVKLVMIALLMASLWSWTIIFEKRRTLRILSRRAARFEDAFWSGEPLDKLYERVRKSQDDPMLKVFASGMDEWQAGVEGGLPSKESLQASLRQRVERAMAMTIGREISLLERGMTFLASVGSTAPFMGLFGTVWGIMNSFTQIAKSQDTSLLVVAPGIAEALFTTALGLVAAIPAVIAYNIFSNAINRYADRLDTFTSEFTSILSRHLDRQESSGGKKK
jgi:biopolymer transport protein TolQ